MAIRLSTYSVTGSRRKHDRLDVTRQEVPAWLLLNGADGQESAHCECRLLNLSYGGMCLHGEDFLRVGGQYRFILDLSGVLGSEVEVTAQMIWKKPIGAGLCYAGALFVKSSAPWFGPSEEDDEHDARSEFDGRGE